MRNPGIIIKLPDERLCIVYRNQPLLKEKGKVILNLLNEDLQLIIGDDKKPKTLIKDVHVYNEMKGVKIIGYID